MSKFQIDHKDHIRFRINYDVDNIILQIKQQIKLEYYYSAYNNLTKLINDNIHHSDIYYLIGEICFKCYHYSSAKKYLLKSLQFEGYCIQALFYLGCISFYENELDTCINYLNKFILNTKIINSYVSESYYILAKIYYKKEDIINSIKNIDKALIINPENTYLKFKEHLVTL